jgi:hypothetical protein
MAPMLCEVLFATVTYHSLACRREQSKSSTTITDGCGCWASYDRLVAIDLATG